MAAQDVQFFVSYAHANRRRADDFLCRLSEQIAPSRRYTYHLWRDVRILVGERWAGEIRQGLDACDLGLLLVSPAFLASGFITREELPRFVGHDGKPVVPVMLEPVHLQRHDLKGLEAHQIFRADGRDGPRAYSECRDDGARRRFVEELFVQIEERLDVLFGTAAP